MPQTFKNCLQIIINITNKSPQNNFHIHLVDLHYKTLRHLHFEQSFPQRFEMQWKALLCVLPRHTKRGGSSVAQPSHILHVITCTISSILNCSTTQISAGDSTHEYLRDKNLLRKHCRPAIPLQLTEMSTFLSQALLF